MFNYGWFFYASQINKQKSIEKQQQITLQANTEIDKRENYFKKKLECEKFTEEAKDSINQKISIVTVSACWTVIQNYIKYSGCSPLWKLWPSQKMFIPKSKKIEILKNYYPSRITELESLLFGNTNIYIDYANIRPWADKLGWHIELKRLKQFLDSFDNIKNIKIYVGTLVGDKVSEDMINKISSYNYDVKTKPVKIMKQSIDYTSINPTSPDLLNKFIRRCLLKKYDLQTVEYLNNKFKELNNNGIFYIEDLKCNFDVEIGRDMLLDYAQNSIDTFMLWSGDSDFADPVEQLLDDNKKVILFATARKVSTELNKLKGKGLFIYDIQKISNFICWKKEIDSHILPLLNAKETP